MWIGVKGAGVLGVLGLNQEYKCGDWRGVWGTAVILTIPLKLPYRGG